MIIKLKKTDGQKTTLKKLNNKRQPPTKANSACLEWFQNKMKK